MFQGVGQCGSSPSEEDDHPLGSTDQPHRESDEWEGWSCGVLYLGMSQSQR